MDQVLEFIVANWIEGIGIAAILGAILVRIVPTSKANLIIDVIGWVVKIIPNRKKGGGVH